MSRRPLVRVLALARPLRRRFGLAALIGALAVGASVGLMTTSGYLISKASTQPEILSLTVAIVAVRFFGVSRGVFRYLERLVAHDAALRLLGRLRVAFFERLEPLVPGGVGVARAGDLLSSFVADVDALQHVYLRALGPVLVAVAVGASSVAVAALFTPAAGIWLAAGLLFAAVALPAATAALARSAGRRQAGARSTLSTEVVELLAAMPELVAYERADAQLGRIDDADARLARIARRDAAAAGLGAGGSAFLTAATTLAVAAGGIAAVEGGALRGVLLAAVVLLATASFEAVRPLPDAAQHLAATAGAAARLLDLTDREPPVRDPERPRPVDSHVLRLEDVGVRYGPEAPWVLAGAELELRPGRRIALLGPSGAGKTTLAHVLVRFRDPDRGRVTIGGHDLRAYAQDDVRAVVALAGQEAHLFATSIRENVRLARPGADETDLVAALERARILEWVESLPDGADTLVGEDGGLVSGGQRQRIALARAFLSRAPLLVLDEPTAHLDPDTATTVLDDLLDAADGTGLLLITHSPLRLERFDEVLRLEQGMIRPL